MSVLLLVEGKTDSGVLTHLIRKAGLGAEFSFSAIGSYEKLRQDLDTELLSATFSRFGIIADADTNLASRWQSLTSRLLEIEDRSTKLFDTLPQAPDPDGTILQSATGRTIGIWLWPDNISAGDLETFAGKLTPHDDSLWVHSGKVISELPEQRFKPTHRNKAQIHTWLSWQDPPDQTIGIAIAKGNLRIDREPATRLLAWLTKLKETTP